MSATYKIEPVIRYRVMRAEDDPESGSGSECCVVGEFDEVGDAMRFARLSTEDDAKRYPPPEQTT